MASSISQVGKIPNSPVIFSVEEKMENGFPEISNRILNILNSANHHKKKKQLIKDFTTISVEDLSTVLDNYFQDATEKFNKKDPSKIIDDLAKIIPFEKLQEAVCGDKKTALETAKSMLHQAKYYLEHSKSKASYTLKARISDIIDSILSFIESVLNAFGVKDFFKPASTELERNFKFQKIMMLVSLFSMLITMTLPLLGVTMGAPIIGGVLLVIAVLSMIYPLISPAPNHLPNADNWTKMYHQGKLGDLSVVKGRKKILDSIAHTMTNSDKGKLKKHPLLIGKSGVGKTQTAQAFVQAIERGDYPELKGKKVFYVNTPELFNKADAFTGVDPLKKIIDAIGRHRNEIILVFDEIHVACQSGKNALLGEKLKKMLDPAGELPYVIGITTSNEFLAHNSKNIAFVRRFNPITVENTDQTVTQEILSHTLLKNGPTTLVEKDALEKIYTKTSDLKLTQPNSSLEVLNECIIKTSEAQTLPHEVELEQLRNKKSFLASQGASGLLNFDAVIDHGLEIEKLEDQIQALEKELKAERKKRGHIFHMKDRLSKVKKRTYRTVMKVAAAKETALTKKDKTNLNAVLLMSRFLAPALEASARSQAKKYNMNIVVDENIIDEVMLSQKQADQKKVEALKEAKLYEKEQEDKVGL